MKASICVLNYNMPDMTDSLVQDIKRKVKIDHKLFVIDNGSLPNKVPKSTTHRFNDNRRLTGGMNRCLDAAKDSDFVWLVTNDVWLTQDSDPLQSMISLYERDTNIGVLHPSLIKPVPDYAYPWMLTEHKSNNIYCNMVDIICPLYTKKALDYNNWKFDERFEYGWGIDYDSCYIARNNGLKIAIDYNIVIGHKTSITYDSGNDLEFKNRQAYYQKALENMYNVMNIKYGHDWKSKIM